MHATFFIYGSDLPDIYIRITEGVNALHFQHPGPQGGTDLTLLHVDGDMDNFYTKLVETVLNARPKIKDAIVAEALTRPMIGRPIRGRCPGCDKEYKNMDLNRCPICDIGLLEALEVVRADD